MKKIIQFSALFFVFLFAETHVLSNTIHVPANYSTIQAALSAATTNDTVLVQPGTYNEIIIWPAVNGIKLISAGDTTNTIIKGNESARVIKFPSDNYYDTTTLVKGFTITNGNGGLYLKDANPKLEHLNITRNEFSHNYWAEGGGIYCDNSSPILNNVSITYNVVKNGNWHEGAGLYCYDNSSPILTNVLIAFNTMGDSASFNFGGGMYCYDNSSPILNNVVITSNTSGNGGNRYFGGGLYCSNNSNPLLTKVAITSNVMGDGGTWYYGAGVYCDASSPVFTDVLIASNIMGVYGTDDWNGGGGIKCNDCPNVKLVNVTIAENARADGSAIYGTGIQCDDSNVDLINTILWNGNPGMEIGQTNSSIDISYSDIRGGWNGPGNLNTDPLFVDPENLNFHLTENSPCIDAGNPDSIYFDPDGTIADMGAFYFDQSHGTQQINISTGFSFISSRIIPDNPDMLTVIEEILNDNLGFVRNSIGQTLRKIGPNWVNGIGDWIVEEGYLVKMFADDSFTITGAFVDPLTPIPIEAGFQFVSYFPETPLDALIAFETILGDDLDFIRNSQGQILRKIGPNWVNGIGDCQPGEGYLVKMYADDVLIYPSTLFTCGNPFTDPRDEQVYNTIQISNQCWMAKNLNIGEMINGYENMTDNGVIEKYCYDNDPANCEIYGGLYQWDEIMQYVTDTATQGICPEGWHLPTNGELFTIIDFLGGPSIAGGKMKETGFEHWNPPNTGATNESGFCALPGGFCSGSFSYLLGFNGYWWSSTQFSSSNAWYWRLDYDNSNIYLHHYNKIRGFSVRCLRGISIIHKDLQSKFDNLSILEKGRSYESSGQKTKRNETIHFVFEAGNPAEAVYTLYIKGLEIGDEVAAFDGEKMIGATRINSQNPFENELPIFSTLSSGVGYEKGNPIILKVWSENNIVSVDFTMKAIYDSYVSDVYPEGDGKYSVVNITKGSIENKDETISIYPNPSDGIFNISLKGVKGDISIKVLDLRGKEYSNFKLHGSTSTQLDLTDLAAGVYFISFSGGNFSEVEKIVLQ